MTPDWRDDARQLRVAGMSIRKIAAEVGMSRGVVGELFKPTTCECGRTMMHGSELCLNCRRTADRERMAERARRISEMWAAGASWSDIGAEFGWDNNHTSAEFGRIRKTWPGLLPYRRTDEQRERIRDGRWGEAA